MLEDTANKLKALSHPVRLAIIDLLKARSALTVSDIQSALNIEQTAASYHLIQMKNKGLLASSKQANMVFYRISHPDVLKVMEALFSEMD